MANKDDRWEIGISGNWLEGGGIITFPGPHYHSLFEPPTQSSETISDCMSFGIFEAQLTLEGHKESYVRKIWRELAKILAKERAEQIAAKKQELKEKAEREDLAEEIPCSYSKNYPSNYRLFMDLREKGHSDLKQLIEKYSRSHLLATIVLHDYSKGEYRDIVRAFRDLLVMRIEKNREAAKTIVQDYKRKDEQYRRNFIDPETGENKGAASNSENYEAMKCLIRHLVESFEKQYQSLNKKEIADKIHIWLEQKHVTTSGQAILLLAFGETFKVRRHGKTPYSLRRIQEIIREISA